MLAVTRPSLELSKGWSRVNSWKKIMPREKISDFSSGSLGFFINSSGAV